MSLIMEAWRERGYAPPGSERMLQDYEDKLELERNKQDLIYALKYPPAPPPPPPPSPEDTRNEIYARLYPPSNGPAPQPELENLSDGTLGVAGDVHAIRKVLDASGVEHYLPFRHNSIVIGLPDVAKARNALAGARWGGNAEADAGYESGFDAAADNSAYEATGVTEPASGDQRWVASPAMGAAVEKQPNFQAAQPAKAAQALPTARPAWNDHLGHIETSMLEAILAQRYVMQLRGRGAEGYPVDGLPGRAAQNLPGSLSQAPGQGIAADGLAPDAMLRRLPDLSSNRPLGRDGANNAFAYGLPMDSEEAKRMVAPLSAALILNPANPLNPLNPANPAHPGNLLNPGRPGVRAFVPPGPPGPPGKPDPRTDTVVPGPSGLVPINPGASSAPPSVGQAIIQGISNTSPILGAAINVLANGAFSASPDTSIRDVEISSDAYPEANQHIRDSQNNGHPDVLTIGRDGRKNRRSQAMAGQSVVPGKDRDEYPPAVFEEGGVGASVRPISPSDNRGSGAYIGGKIRDLPNGSRVRLIAK